MASPLVDQSESKRSESDSDSDLKSATQVTGPCAIEGGETSSAPPIEIHGQNDGTEDRDATGQEHTVTRSELADRIQKSDRWMIGLTAVIAIGGAVSAAIFGYQLNEMKVAAELTRESIKISRQAIDQGRESLIATQRPWLSIQTEIVSPLTWDNGAIELRIGVIVKNVGLTPALTARIFEVLDPKGGRKGSDFCKAQRGRDTALFGHTIFPGATQKDAGRVRVSAEDVKGALLKSGFLAPTITVCVDYRSTLDSLHHQSFYTFLLYEDPKIAHRGLAVIDPKRGNVTLKNLRLESVYGDNSAD
jgi:hypothetical protein